MARPRGLSLAGLRALRGDAIAKGWVPGTTTALKYDFVLGATAEGRTYAALLAARPDGAALEGPASVFLSHAYDYNFDDVLDAATAWEAKQQRGTFFYYFDLAVVDQHAQKSAAQAGVVAPNVLSDEFGEGVRAIARTVLVLCWESPLVLQRSWCIFEVAMTLFHDAAFHVALPPRDERILTKLFSSRDNFSSIEKKICAIDAARATAREPADKATIDCEINDKLGGFGSVNERIAQKTRDWVIDTVHEKLCAAPDFLTSPLALGLGAYMRHGTMSRADGGLKLLELALERRKGAFDAQPESRELELNVALAESACGSSLRLAGKSADAAALLKNALATLERLGADEHDVIDACSRLSVALKDLGRHDEALPLYERAYGQRLKAYGADHEDTLFSHLNLGVLYHAMRRYDEHSKIVAEVARRRNVVLGPRHHETLFARHREGLGLFDAGEYERAKDVFSEVAELQREVRGPAHRETLSTRTMRARSLAKQVEGDETTRKLNIEVAACELNDIVDVQVDKLGSDHMDAVFSLFVLAQVLCDGGFLAAGCRAYLRAVNGARKSTGRPPFLKTLLDRAAAAAPLLAASSTGDDDLASKLAAAIADARICGIGGASATLRR